MYTYIYIYIYIYTHIASPPVRLRCRGAPSRRLPTRAAGPEKAWCQKSEVRSSLYTSISLSLYLSISISLYPYLSVSVSLYIPISLSISFYLSISLSDSLFAQLPRARISSYRAQSCSPARVAVSREPKDLDQCIPSVFCNNTCRLQAICKGSIPFLFPTIETLGKRKRRVMMGSLDICQMLPPEKARSSPQNPASNHKEP